MSEDVIMKQKLQNSMCIHCIPTHNFNIYVYIYIYIDSEYRVIVISLYCDINYILS